MIINHKYKFIFIHVPKCAGTAIKRALYPYCDKWDQFLGGHPDKPERIDNMHKHSTAMEIKGYATPERWEEYFTFSFVRNPLARMLSLYNWWQKVPGGFEPEKKEIISKLSFKEFVFSDYNGYSQVHFLASKAKKDTFVSAQNRIELDFIGRQESVKRDFAYFCGLNKLPQIELNIHNATRTDEQQGDFRYHKEFYDEESTREVKRKFAEDFETFGYK
jgi:hypothetical protein